MNRFERKYEAKPISKPSISTSTALNSILIPHGSLVVILFLRNLCVQQQSGELSFFVEKRTRREMFLFHTSPISSTTNSFVDVTLPKRKRLTYPAYDILLSCSSVPESANLRYFSRRYLWTWTLTHTNNFLSFLSLLWNVSFCWSMLLPP